MIRKTLCKTFAFCLVAFVLYSCKKQETSLATPPLPSFEEAPLVPTIQEEISKKIQDMSLTQKLSQLFLINLEGNTKFVPVEYIENEPIIAGAYILFSYNIAENAQDVKKFIHSIKSYATEHNAIEPFVCCDQEGGYVCRLRGVTSVMPSAKKVAQMPIEEAQKIYETQAKQMAELGLDLNLAPLAEIEDLSNADFLQSRSFGTKEKVLEYGSLFVKSFAKNNVATCLKHFPGNANVDPHTQAVSFAINEEQLSDIKQVFSTLIQQGASVVLMSHATVSPVDALHNACLSPIWIKKVLREEIGFNGLVISDDILMAAVSGKLDTTQAIINALLAGVNCIMISEKRFAPYIKSIAKTATLDSTLMQAIDDSVYRVLLFKHKQNLNIML